MMQTDLIPRGVATTLKKLLFWVPVWLLTTLRENLLALRYSIVHIQINKHGSKKKPPPPAEEEQGNLGETSNTLIRPLFWKRRISKWPIRIALISEY